MIVLAQEVRAVILDSVAKLTPNDSAAKNIPPFFGWEEDGFTAANFGKTREEPVFGCLRPVSHIVRTFHPVLGPRPPRHVRDLGFCGIYVTN